MRAGMYHARAGGTKMSLCDDLRKGSKVGKEEAKVSVRIPKSASKGRPLQECKGGSFSFFQGGGYLFHLPPPMLHFEAFSPDGIWY